MRLFGREAGIVEPALIEEVSGAVRTSGPRERGDRVNHKPNVLCLSCLLGAMGCRSHRGIRCYSAIIGRSASELILAAPLGAIFEHLSLPCLHPPILLTPLRA